MSDLVELELKLKNVPCLRHISEDELHQLVGALYAVMPSEQLERAVTFKGGGSAWLELDGSGLLYGKARVANQELIWLNPRDPVVKLGAPNASNPGPGFEVLSDLTKLTWNQGNDESQWTQFYAVQSGLINPTINTNP